jgi:hypothetical protein
MLVFCSVELLVVTRVEEKVLNLAELRVETMESVKAAPMVEKLDN